MYDHVHPLAPSAVRQSMTSLWTPESQAGSTKHMLMLRGKRYLLLYLGNHGNVEPRSLGRSTGGTRRGTDASTKVMGLTEFNGLTEFGLTEGFSGSF